ncbi:MAG TPA: ATP-binding cassette domain-containing protein [Tepidisphaeraceae bacterium]|jgi:ABC-2 type transport system ATP-binding protein|nr:ATP-binding cassette domain-containing protein [Tepidisphaeraceae bacterium]
MAAAPYDHAIDLKHVAKIYRGNIHALQGIGMHVRRGEVFGLLGPNGAGKSTLVKIMMTVVRPTRAEGTILGNPVGDKSTLARVGYLPENHRFPRYLTGRQTLEFFGALAKVDRRTAKRRAGELLDTVGMAGWANHKVGTYSKGMMQRIGLAQALMGDPDLVLLDEPTDGVDPVGRKDIRDVMSRLRRQGKTVFLNSHVLTELESICDRVAILVRGQVARQGTIDELTVARQRYEIELAWPDPLAGREKVLTALAAPWSAVQTTTPIPAPPRYAPPTAMPHGFGPSGHAPAPPMPGYGSFPNGPGRAPYRTVDCCTLPSGHWAELDGPVLRVGVTDPADVQPVLDALRGAGLIVRRVQPMRVSLEDLFMEAVNGPAPGGRIAADPRTAPDAPPGPPATQGAFQ